MRCGGTGRIQLNKIPGDFADCSGCEDCRCPVCKGEGEIKSLFPDKPSYPCQPCHGSGRKEREG